MYIETNYIYGWILQSNAHRLPPAFDCCRASGNQIVVHSSDNEQGSAVVVSWEDSPNTWLTAAKNAFVGWAFNFRVRVLLKSAVSMRGGTGMRTSLSAAKWNFKQWGCSRTATKEFVQIRSLSSMDIAYSSQSWPDFYWRRGVRYSGDIWGKKRSKRFVSLQR